MLVRRQTFPFGWQFFRGYVKLPGDMSGKVPGTRNSGTPTYSEVWFHGMGSLWKGGPRLGMWEPRKPMAHTMNPYFKGFLWEWYGYEWLGVPLLGVPGIFLDQRSIDDFQVNAMH